MKTYIWTIPTRFFHWMLAIGFAAAFLLGENDDLRNWHFTFGAFVGCLLAFRLLYGFFGPRYSRFRDFPIGLKQQTAFIKGYFSKQNEYAGHNPMASLIMLLIILVGIFTAMSGYSLYKAECGTCLINEETAEGLHGALSKTFLVLVILHLAGLLADLLFHSRAGTLQSMFTGYKNLDAEPARLNTLHKPFIVLWFIVPFFVAYLANTLPVSSSDEEEDGYELYESEEHDD